MPRPGAGPLRRGLRPVPPAAPGAGAPPGPGPGEGPPPAAPQGAAGGGLSGVVPGPGLRAGGPGPGRQEPAPGHDGLLHPLGPPDQDAHRRHAASAPGGAPA